MNRPCDVLDLLGPTNTTIVRIVPGEKRPIAKEWQKLRPTDMTPDYLASFADGEGIGVNLGAASWSAEGNSLYSIDVDDDENFGRMIELNPTFAETLQTNGARGGNFWLYVKGACPPSCILFLRDGQRFGEWRGSGMQTVIAGPHPCGRPYTNNGHKPITVEFSAIGWLEIVALPWDMKRPGVSTEFVATHGVRYVGAEEAKTLLGFKPSGGGLWIPYFGFNAPGALMIDDRAYGRLRLDEPTRGAKYLSPKDSGAQLYVSAMCGPFEKELVVCEGEFKALSLCEAGIPAVAVGGVSSAMTGGKLIADLEKLLSKFPSVGTVYFLGDADTALNFEFSREAVKLAGVLPDGCVLKLPRIPFGGPKGIDDCRQEFGAEFQAFWEGIKMESVEVGVEMDMSTLAGELIVPALEAIGKLKDGQKRYLKKIVALAGRLGPIAFDEVAKAVKKHLGINRESFRDEVAKARDAQAEVFTPRDDKEAWIVASYGAPYSRAPNGEVLTNEKFFAAAFALKRRALFEVTEGRFYLYNQENGAWCNTSVAIVKGMISSDWHEFARRENLKALDRKGSSGCVNAICELLKGHVAQKGAFKPLYAMLHCANGMLKITESETILHPFSPEYYSRNPIPVAWNPEAKCPQFMDVLLNPAMDQDDADLLVRWGGSVLLGVNYAQRFAVLEGTSGGGKGTFVEVLEAINGEGNSVQMRTALLEERFEIGRFIGKTLLAGKDVAGDFLEKPGASVIKSLVGHDKLTAEIKGSMETPDVKGIFGVVITCNSRLRVRLMGDVEAWRRRMLLIRYDRPKPEHRIAGFSEKLLSAEAEGILALFVRGAMRHLGELRELGDFRITAKQQECVDALLLESDSLRHFARARIVAAESGVLPTADVVGAYFEFCREEGWVPLPPGRVYRELPDIMIKLFGSNLGSHGENEKGERLRGYPKVALQRGGYTAADINLEGIPRSP